VRLTVYNRGHIGNFRTYVCLDVLRRTLKYLCGYKVQQVVNYTDVDDKTIAGAQKAGMPLREYTDQWIRAFREDAARSESRRPRNYPARPTGEYDGHVRHDPRARAQWPHLQRDGSVYFKIASLPSYGRLARLDHDGLHAGARVDVDEYSKDDARDFVLWKAAKPGEPSWECNGAGPDAGLAHRVFGHGRASAR
jgi:cysteinyl-tRNA synthetase